MHVVTGIQNFFVISSNMDDARKFYEEGLGLTAKFADGDKWLQMSAGGMNFAVASPSEAGKPAPEGIIVFETDDLAAAKVRIVAFGGAVVSERDMGSHGRTIAADDPAGNRIHFFSRA